MMLSNAGAASLGSSPEDRYVATRDAAIARFSSIHDAGRIDDAAKKDEETARADLQAQMSAILGELNRNGADGWYVEPKAHIIITTQAILARWLRAHKDWWDKGLKNVPQQIAAALRNKSFYTQAMSTDAAVVNFDLLPIAKPTSAIFAFGMLAGLTQDDIPDAADEVFVSAIANGKVYIACGSIEQRVQIAACAVIRADYNKRAEGGDEDFRLRKIDKQAYDRLGDLRRQGEDAYKRCFSQRAAAAVVR